MEYKEALSLANKLTGSLIELGFGKGNSLKEFIGYMNDLSISKRNIWIYESFDGYNTPGPEDQGAFKKGEFKRPPQPAYDIRNTIKAEVRLVKGYIEETLPLNFDNSQVAIVHSHLVSYSSTLHGLNFFSKFIPPDGVIIVTDYEIYPGTKQAVDEFVAKHSPHYKFVDVNNNFAAIKRQKVVKFQDRVSRTKSILT
jgi:O-methyltransferase